MEKELILKAKGAKTPEELMALAKENGNEMTEESAKAYFELLHPTTGELSDDELDNVAGGSCYASDGRMVVSLGYSCRGFRCKKDGGRPGGHICIVVRCLECGDIADCDHCKFCTYEKGLWLCNNPEKIK